MKKIVILSLMCLFTFNAFTQTQVIDNNLQLNLPVTYSQSKSFLIFGNGNNHVIQGQAWTGTSDSNVKSRISFTQLGLELQYPETFNSFVTSTTFQTGIFLSSGYYGSTKGYVGIGTTAPLAKLHIKNGDNSYGAILSQANESNFQLYTKTLTTQPASVESFRLGLKYGSDENNSFVSFYRGGGSSGGFLGLSTNGVERFRITTDGKVGIGTANPKNALDVVGTIRATEIKVEAAPWPDYVFEDNYQLKSLNDIKAYIKEHKHLPDVPSAEMMAKEGVNLGEVNKLLMQKIEELTLYVIDLEEKNAAQEAQLNQIQQLQADLDLLKKMVLTQLNK